MMVSNTAVLITIEIGRRLVTRAGDHEPDHQSQRNKEHQELNRGQHPLHGGPDRGVPAGALLGCVKLALAAQDVRVSLGMAAVDSFG